MRPVVLSIAGSDSSAGAGIQADLKTIEALGGYAVTVVTAATAQNTREVRRVDRLPLASIGAQLEAVFDDFEVAAVKTGMLVDGEVVELVAGTIAARRPPIVVCDPVMISTSGVELLDAAGVATMVERLLPVCSVVTPNVAEAERLSTVEIDGPEAAERAARKIRKTGVGAVLVKGGHLPGASATDVLVDRRGARLFVSTYIDSKTTHGTGCVLAAALATQLALGSCLRTAVERAKAFTGRALRHGVAVGHGPGPLDPLFRLHGARSSGEGNDAGP